MQQQQQQQQQQLQQQQQEEWFRQQQLLQFQQQQQQQQPLVPAVTGFGSNNPFAATSASPISSPPLSAPQPSVQFNLGGTYQNGAPSSSLSSFTTSPPPQPQQSLSAPASAAPSTRGPSRTDQEHSQLASLFAQRGDDGVDSFGNTGALRYGQQASLALQPTGAPSHNPFAQLHQQQQPQQQYGQGGDQPFFSI